MIKIKNITFILLSLFCILLLSTTCKKDPWLSEPDEAYYQFSSSDSANLLSYVKGDTLKFVNQKNESRMFLVDDINYVVEAVDGERDDYYCETKSIFIGNEEQQIVFHFYFKQVPLDSKLAAIYHNVIHPSKLFSILDFYPYKLSGYFARQRMGLTQELIEMNINGKIYKNVVVLKTRIEEEVAYKYNIHTIYCCTPDGIIGFDDREGNEWRIDN